MISRTPPQSIPWLLKPLALLLALAPATGAQANDAAAETAAGGVRLKRERSVLMEQERLTIARERVQVEYLFRNTGSEPVESEVAFPIPPVRFEYDDPGGPRDFADFKVWVDGQPLPVTKEVRAFVGAREVTAELSEAGIDIARFGHFEPWEARTAERYQVRRLDPERRRRLIELGALEPTPAEKGSEPEAFWPLWENRIVFHWTQRFAPGEAVKVRHEYRPVVGFSWFKPEAFFAERPDACVDDATRKAILRAVAECERKEPQSNRYFDARWVSYILTTANSWQTPIRDFELIVEKSDPKQRVSFCWEGPVERISPTRFRARMTDFVPTRELSVYFMRFDNL